MYGRFPKFHRVFLGRDPGTLKSDIVSTKTSIINLFGFETLKLKIRRLKLWKPTVLHDTIACYLDHTVSNVKGNLNQSTYHFLVSNYNVATSVWRDLMPRAGWAGVQASSRQYPSRVLFAWLDMEVTCFCCEVGRERERERERDLHVQSETGRGRDTRAWARRSSSRASRWPLSSRLRSTRPLARSRRAQPSLPLLLLLSLLSS